jgi:hypothetical protein
LELIVEFKLVGVEPARLFVSFDLVLDVAYKLG